MEQFNRVIGLLGKSAFEELQRSTVIVMGIGGVGSACVHSLARSGVGRFLIIDSDSYEKSNLNRQWPSNYASIGKSKVSVLKEELQRFCKVEVITHQIRLNKTNFESILGKYKKNKSTFFIDAIDDVPVKIDLLEFLYDQKVNFISSMGAANVLDLSKIRITDLSKTNYCPLAKKVRIALKKRKIKKGVPVVYSNENRQNISGSYKASVMPVTATFGHVLSSWVVNFLMEKGKKSS